MIYTLAVSSVLFKNTFKDFVNNFFHSLVFFVFVVIVETPFLTTFRHFGEVIVTLVMKLIFGQ